MTELLTAAQMRAIEQAAIDSGEVTGLELMERAGQGVVDAVFAEWPQLAPAAGTAWGPAPSPLSLGPMAQQRRPPRYLRPKEEVKRRAVVLCGPGNNGGDGFVVARLLHGLGWDVDVFFYGDAERLPPDARVNYERWCTLGNVQPLSERGFRAVPDADVYVDALFGTGVSRPVEGAAFDVLSHMAGRNGDDFAPKTVAIDAPSGLCLDSGVLLGRGDGAYANGMVRFAALTVTFDCPKVGHFIDHGPALCGKVKVVDIGLANWRCFQKTLPDKPAFIQTAHGPMGAVRPIRTELTRLKPIVPDLRLNYMMFDTRVLTKARQGDAHKYSFGHALVLSGGVGRGGAARLAARGALRIGAGAVTLGCPPAALLENAIALDAVMTRKVKDADGLSDILADGRINSICVGPGFGTGAGEVAVITAALNPSAKRRVVLDADALTLLARDPDLFALLHDQCVLTPHAGEFKRLFPDLAEKLTWREKRPGATTVTKRIPAAMAFQEALKEDRGPAYSKVDATRDAAKRAGCIVLFKGPDTVIADPNGRCIVVASVYDDAAPWLATAGSGDVLAGFITGLMSRRFLPLAAAQMGAWLHARCARQFGPGLIAEDLPEQLPTVFRELGV
ncbi:MAG: NAD(P)H-hydrate epimerase [Yoonia sp.]|uniref:NAD(P)H-hydrate epimerase n=1 Tax=Yoonia sp. TaxID=2212373 RepID=UPI003267D86F